MKSSCGQCHIQNLVGKHENSNLSPKLSVFGIAHISKCSKSKYK